MIGYISIQPSRLLKPKVKFKPSLIKEGHVLVYCRGCIVDIHKDNPNMLYLRSPEHNLYDFTDNLKKELPLFEYDNRVEVYTQKAWGIPKTFHKPDISQDFMVNIVPLLKLFLITGVSSSGKSTIASKINIKGYTVREDDRFDPKLLPNQSTKSYATQESSGYLSVFNESFYHGQNIILDTVTHSPNPSLYNILIYRSLDDLCKSLMSRAKSDYRSRQVFTYFNQFYKVDDQTLKPLGVISRPSFEKSLLTYCKFLFMGRFELVAFSYMVFEKLGINDDQPHKLVPVSKGWDKVLVNEGNIKDGVKLVKEYIERHK